VSFAAASPHLDVGRAALARGDWEEAKAAFELALGKSESPEALEGLGLAAWWLDRGDAVFDSRERAYALYRERGDRASAARLAVWLAWDYTAFRGESVVAHGWLGRAKRLLDGAGVEAGRERAWLALREGAFALLEAGDPREALARAEEAVRVGQSISSADHEMTGRSLAGFAKVTAGDVAEGMRELDEVSAAILAGEMSDHLSIGLSCCYMIAACERVRDYDRALQWCTRLKSYCEKWGLRPLSAVCRTQYASVCIWRGTWGEAERELTLATAELAAARPAMTSEGLVRLAELRRLQGRVDEAEEMFGRAEPHPHASLGMAELALDRGDARSAADHAERYLRRLPRHNRVERAAGLELGVRARLALGRRSDAQSDFVELEAIAADIGTAPLVASAGLAAGLLAFADGDFESARRHFEDAVDRLQPMSAPYESSRARIELARALAALGRADDARAEASRAIDALEAVQASGELAKARAVFDGADAAAASLPKVALKAPTPTPPPAASLLTAREREVLALVAEGLSNPAIGERLFVSEHTVHRHVSNILTKLDVPSRAAAVAEAARRNLL